MYKINTNANLDDSTSNLINQKKGEFKLALI